MEHNNFVSVCYSTKNYPISGEIEAGRFVWQGKD